MAASVRAALYGLLAGDTTLAGLLSSPTDGIFHQRAPQSAKTPYVIFAKHTGSPMWTFRTPMQWDTWLVKGVDRAGKAGRAEHIAEVIDALLNDAQLTIPGFDHLYLRRASDVDYPEPDGAETYHHCGGLYTVVTDPT